MPHSSPNIQARFRTQLSSKKLLSVYYTAGYPNLDDTLTIAQHLQAAGVDFLEIGIPYSDPVADGPTIQHSSNVALQQGMTLSYLLRQLENLRETVHIPVFLMGYFNPILQFGVKAFCEACAKIGIDGVIIPDLPLEVYERDYRELFEQHRLTPVFLITPMTSEARIRKIDALSRAFIYMLSTPSVTGGELALSEDTLNYFKRIAAMNLNTATIVGFGISSKEIFDVATRYAEGAIVGSKFVRLLGEMEGKALSSESIHDFVKRLKC